MIIEPIQGDAGVVVPPNEYFQELSKILRENDILLIDDDVQTSLGRTGRMFGVENWGVVPDMIAIAKSVGGGLPLGAMIAQKEIADAWEPGSHSSTTGGNPVACVAGLATLEIILKEKLGERAEKEGEYAIKRIRDMMDDHKMIGDVRGKGLIIGLELVKDREFKTPAIEETEKVIRECFKRKLIVMGAGLGHVNVVRLLPALNIPREYLDQGLDILDESLAAVE
jgi:4-aminobutyrate aminotransferase-like enzyme